jgi:hypothetical protein
MIIRNFIITAFLVLFSINGIGSAVEEVDTFEIETEGNYRMEAGSSVDLAKKVVKHDFGLQIAD